MSSKAIVFVGCGYPMGGVLFLAHMGVAIARMAKGADFYFAAIDRATQDGYWDVVRKDIPENQILHAPAFDELAKMTVMLAEKYAKVLVHTAGGWGQTKFVCLAKRMLPAEISRRIVLVGTTHSYRNDSRWRIPMSLLQYWMYRAYYRAVVFQCQYAAKRFCGGRRLIRCGRGEIIPLGCEEFSDAALRAPLRGLSHAVKDVLEDSSLFKFVYLAAFRPGKMHVWLISSIAKALKANPHVRLILCGTGPRSMIEEIESCIAENEISSQVLCAGLIARADIPSVLGHCSCAVVASRSETFGHNYLEPMFAGLPVIGTPVGVGAEIIKNGETGYLFSHGDEKSFQAAVERVIRHPKLAAEMGKNARRLVTHGYRHEDVAIRHVDLYQRILAED